MIPPGRPEGDDQMAQPIGAVGPAASGTRRWRAMTVADLEQVLLIEQQAYSFPWSRGNFIDSMAAGYPAWMLLSAGDPELAPRLVGYYVAMPGFEEMHLLNITVHPAQQGQGHARAMLVHLASHALAVGAHTLWLEVRESNARARRLYETSGFETVGRRKGYYPLAAGAREDALVMRWPPALDPAADSAAHSVSKLADGASLGAAASLAAQGGAA